jgi:hypothetical protein
MIESSELTACIGKRWRAGFLALPTNNQTHRVFFVVCQTGSRGLDFILFPVPSVVFFSRGCIADKQGTADAMPAQNIIEVLPSHAQQSRRLSLAEVISRPRAAWPLFILAFYLATRYHNGTNETNFCFIVNRFEKLFLEIFETRPGITPETDTR